MSRIGYDYRDVYCFLEEIGYRVFEPDRSMTEAAGVRVWDGDPQANWDILAMP